MYYTANSPEEMAEYLADQRKHNPGFQLQVVIANTDFWVPIEESVLLDIARVHGTERMRAHIIFDGLRFYWMPREDKS